MSSSITDESGKGVEIWVFKVQDDDFISSRMVVVMDLDTVQKTPPARLHNPISI
jgi:hypothetical protein